MLGNFACFFFRRLIFVKINFSKKTFRNTVSECQTVGIQIVGSGLRLNCRQNLSVDAKKSQGKS